MKSLVALDRKSLTDNTAIQRSHAVILILSLSPMNGVGKCAVTFGTSRMVRAKKNSITTTVTTE